jgi:outer membrane receptor protein involved in Fe transport/uncharacterized protein YhjY with autotransporter beta-barrel domain
VKTVFDIETNNRFFNADVESISASLYGSYAFDDTFLDASITKGFSDVDSQRLVSVGDVLRTPTADYSTDQLSAQLLVGKELVLTNNLSLSAYAGLTYSNIEADSYSEVGGSAANLVVMGQDYKTLETVQGFALRGNYSNGNGGRIVPALSVNVRREALDNTQDNRAGFSLAPDAYKFTSQGVNSANGLVDVGAEVNFYNVGPIDVTASYNYARSEEYSDSTVALKFRWTGHSAEQKRSVLASYDDLDVVNTGSDLIDFDGLNSFRSPLNDDLGQSLFYGLGVVAAVDDLRYSIFTVNGLQLESSTLDYAANDGFRSVTRYLGNTPIHTDTGSSDFDHSDYFARNDTERVQVAANRGATFYGSSGLAGVVKYTPIAPQLDESSARIGFSTSSIDGAKSFELGNAGDLTVNVPLTDSVAFRMSGGVLRTEGTTDYRNLYVLDNNGIPVNAASSTAFVPASAFESQEGVNDFESEYGRASLLWQPNDQWQAQFTLMHQDDERGGNRVTTEGVDGFGVDYDFNESGSLIVEPKERTANVAALDLLYSNDNIQVSSNTSAYEHSGQLIDDVTGVAGSASFLISAAEFCENTAGTPLVDGFCLADQYPLNSGRPLVVLDREFDEEGYTQEFRLNGTMGEKTDYLIGAYHHDLSRDKTTFVNKPGFESYFSNNAPIGGNAEDVNGDQWSNQSEKLERQESSLYANVTYEVDDRLSIGGGAKWLHMANQESVQRQFPLFSGSDEALRFAPVSAELDRSETELLPSLQLSYQLDDDHQVFFDIEKSYRTGGLNENALIENSNSLQSLNVSSSMLSFDAETAISSRLGLRGNSIPFNDLGLTLSYQASIFNSQAKDKQVNGFINSRDTRDQLQQGIVLNADKASQLGLDLSFSGAFSSGWGVAMDYNYIANAELDNDLFTPASVTNLDATFINLNGELVSSGLDLSPTLVGESGSRLPFTPKHLLILKSNYYHQFANFGLNLFGSLSYQSEMESGFSQQSATIDSANQVNLGASLLWDNLGLTFWVNNVTNENISNENNAAPDAVNTSGPRLDQNYLGSGQSSIIALPRVFGITMNLEL